MSRKMAGLLDEFVGLTEEFNRRGIDYAVCGGWAVNLYGFTRATVDIDFIIPSEELERALEAARAHGFDIEGLPLNFDEGKTKIRRISKIDKVARELITLDLILVTPSFEDVWMGRKKVNWSHGEYRVVSVDGLIKMKEIAGRPKDLIDLDYLRGLMRDEANE